MAPGSNSRGVERQHRFRPHRGPAFTDDHVARQINTPTLAFVHIDHPGQIKHVETQRRIRRHVMKPIGRSRRRRDKCHWQHADDNGALLSTYTPPPKPPSHRGMIGLCGNFKRLFHAMDMVAEGVISMAVGKWSRETMHVWSNHCERNRQVSIVDDTELYNESLRLVRRSVAATRHPPGQTQYATIGTIVCLAYFDLRGYNSQGWEIHMQGLEHVVRLCGGVEALDSHPALRQSLFIGDVLGSMVHDTLPRFSLPLSLNPSSSSSPSLSSLDQTSLGVMDSALESASRLIVWLNCIPQQSPDTHADPVGLRLMMSLNAIAHDLLSLPRFDCHAIASPRTRVEPTAQFDAAAELVRISALALVSIVQTAASGGDSFFFTAGRSRFNQKARLLIALAEDQSWVGRHHVRLWVLVIVAMMMEDVGDEDGTATTWELLLGQIVHVMDSLHLRSWGAVMTCLHEVAWIEHAAMPEVTGLKCDVEQRLRHSMSCG